MHCTCITIILETQRAAAIVEVQEEDMLNAILEQVLHRQPQGAVFAIVIKPTNRCTLDSGATLKTSDQLRQVFLRKHMAIFCFYLPTHQELGTESDHAMLEQDVHSATMRQCYRERAAQSIKPTQPTLWIQRPAYC
jgi:hypothetical protein